MWKFELNNGPAHNDYFVDWFRFICAKTKFAIKIKRLFYSIFTKSDVYVGNIFKV